jgi:hypothetical protein
MLLPISAPLISALLKHFGPSSDPFAIPARLLTTAVTKIENALTIRIWILFDGFDPNV